MNMASERSYWTEIKDTFSTDVTLSGYPVFRPLYSMFFIEILGWAMTIPVIAFFILKDLGLGPWELGLALSSFSLAQVFGSAVFGRVSDAFGRRPVALTCFFWASLGLFATALVRNFTELLITRVVAGLSGGTWPLCQAYVLDVVPVWDRGKYVGLLGATFSLGLSSGPGISAGLLFSGLVGRRTIFMISGCVAASGAIMGYFLLKESMPEERKRPLCGKSAEQEEEAKAESDWEATNVGLVLIWIARMACAFGEFFMYSMYAILIHDLFGFEDKEMGIILMCMGIVGAIINMLVFPATVRFVGPASATILGCTCAAIGLALLPTSGTLGIHLCFLFIFTFGTAHSSPGFPVVCSQYCSLRHLGFANGWLNSFRGISAVFSPLAGGFLYERVGPIATFSVAGGGALCAAGLLVVVKCCTTPPEVKDDEKAFLVKGKGKGKGQTDP